jgi:hypothetical protein
MEYSPYPRECCVCYDDCCNYIVSCKVCNDGVLCSHCLIKVINTDVRNDFSTDINCLFNCAICRSTNWLFYSRKTYIEDLEYDRIEPFCPALKVFKRNRDLYPTDVDIDIFAYELTCNLFNTVDFRHDDIDY